MSFIRGLYTSIRSKIIMLLVVEIISMIGVIGFSLSALNKSSEQFDDLEAQALRLLILSKDIKFDVVQVQQWLTDISATRGAEGFDDGYAEAKKYWKDLKGLLVDLDKLGEIFDDDIKKEIQDEARELNIAFDSFYETGKKMADLYIQNLQDVSQQSETLRERIDSTSAVMGEVALQGEQSVKVNEGVKDDIQRIMNEISNIEEITQNNMKSSKDMLKISHTLNDTTHATNELFSQFKT